MKIVVDLRSVHSGLSGIGRYALNLWLSLLTSDRGFTVEGITTSAGKEFMGPVAKCSLHVVRSVGPEWDELALPDLLRARDADLYHTPLFILPSIRTCKYVCTVHDVIPLVRPDLTHESFARFFHGNIERAFKVADHLVAVSEHSRQDVLQAYQVDVSRITAIHEPVNPLFCRQRIGKDKKFLDQHSLEPGYILSVGALDRRKNLAGLLDAYSLLIRDGLAPPLVVVGGASGDGFDLAGELHARALGSQVRVLGRVSDEVLSALYSSAGLLAFPSLYEGFGLPVVEAMAAGAPVVTSRVSSLPEIAGDAAILVDPLKAEELAHAMRRLLDDEGLRQELVRKGRARVKMFSLESHGDHLAALYRRVLGVAA
jgi:glycosyltransferase involved in cell wall biosynthesis